MHIVSVVGARPQFVKLAPVAEALRLTDARHTVIHTGQHYDVELSEAIFNDFGLPTPDVNLGVGSGTHAQTTAAIIGSIDPVLVSLDPDTVVVYGDTDSTLAATLAAVKRGMHVAHVEAGLRSFNRGMPEEHNRVLTDHAADLLLAPTQTAMDHLCHEGLSERAVLTGDVMADICLRTADRFRNNPPPDALPDGEFILATIHRPYNTDDPDRLREVITALAGLPLPVVLPAHPRLRVKAHDAGIALAAGAITPIDPLDYSSLIHAAQSARAVVTDSGGLQKEAFLLQVPCTTIRTETEWPETLEGGWNRLCFAVSDPQFGDVVLRVRSGPLRSAPFGAGGAAGRIARVLVGGG